jgi:23S rRNA (pseudouridine1915-N3)-methyltransferase
MKHELILLGKTKDKFIGEGIVEYMARLKHYTSFDLTVLKDKGKSRGLSDLVEAEGVLLLHAIKPGAIVVVLDSRGRQFTSEEWALQISGWEMQGIKQICYLIGGPDGLAPQVVQAADLLLSLSKMTFTHDMTRMLLIEQLYRAYTIKAGENYHK